MLHSEQLEELYSYIEQNDIKNKKKDGEKSESETSSKFTKIRSVRNLLETKDFNSDFDSKKFYRNSSIFTSERTVYKNVEKN